MTAMAAGFVSNIILDYLFVWVKDGGIRGAAWATIISQGITMLLALVYLTVKGRFFPNPGFQSSSYSWSNPEDWNCAIWSCHDTESFTDDNQSIFRRVWRRRSDSHICLYSLYYLYYLSDPAGRWRWKPASYESVLWSGKFEKFKRYPRAGL